MASSEDEGETVPKNVSDYVFLKGNDELIPFTVLPLEWKKGEINDGKPLRIFVRGVTDNGHRKIYKQVTAWKFDLSYVKPEISVLSVEGHWIKLLKPQRLFQHIFMTIQVTLHFLHFVRWNPQQSPKAMWNHLNMTLSMFDRRPCANDLADHLPLINEAVQRDEKLANSKILSTFLVEKPWERNTSEEGVKPSFIVDDANEKEDQEDDMVDEDGDNGSDEDDCFDAVCAICDNGGDLLLCDGKCMRSFHTTIQDDGAFYCESLGLTDEELQAIRDVPFLCENCKYKEHQCFACGKLGSSDESSPEVFCCVNGTCGFFFHPDCVAKLLHPGDPAAAEEFKQRIASGEQFACPAHRCHVCREVEVKSAKDLQFAVCRRCPRAYHRKCLPREITSEEDMDMERGIVRAWEGLIPYRILIYCLDHEIDLNIYTPVRDHIRFPGLSREGEKKLPLESGERKNKPPLEPSTEKNLLRKRGVTSGDDAWKRISAKPPKGFDRVSSSLVPGHISKNQVKNFPLNVSSKKQKLATNGNPLGKTNAGEIPIGEKLYATFFGMDSGHAKSSCAGVVHGENEMSQKANSTTKRIDSSLTLDADSRKRILRLMEDASSSVTLDKVKNKLKAPSTHVQSKFSVTLGKAEASVQALRAALKKLDGGCCLEDAKAVCGEDLLPQVLRWKEKLKVYLAPFLYGTRYTSFGRHFTKIDKLREIVDILHWYVQDGDMLVDFCCGSNDFSCLMREKLDQMGKSCSFRNYDILQAKHDFNFERRDWMRVQPNELPDGSQLIMGLNPPFGVNAALANKFINKALAFKPKLLILIVPRETHRLDVKESPYDLIWEDNEMFVGKSFYLPGSVDVNDEQIEDWNVNAPGLYLWSRSNWTPKHRAIAEQHGHLKNFRLDESCNEMHSPISAQECLNLDKIFAKQGDDLHVDEHKNLRQQKDKVTTPTSHQNLNGISMPHHLAPIMADQLEIDMPRHVENRAPGNSGRNQFNVGYQPYPQTGYNGDEKMNDLVRRYSLNNEESHYGMISSRQAYAPIPPPDYGFNASANQFVVPFEERANNFCQPAFSYQRAMAPTPPPGVPMPTSAMQQYAPPMMGNMVSGPHFQDMSPVYHPRGPQPAFHVPLGFAPGPYPSYFQQTSSGWLNE